MSTKKSAPPKPQVGDEAVKRATGKEWAQWLKLLDAAGAKKMNHREIVDTIAAKYDIGGWWTQQVAVTYEQQRGLREVNQKASGFVAGVSRTINVPIETLYAAWKESRKRAKWLGSAKLTVRTAIENKSMRITWLEDETSVEVYFTAKSPEKSLVTVDHSKLANRDQVAEKKAFWSEALGKLKEQLEG